MSRLKKASISYNAKHPALLPKPFTEVAVRDAHERVGHNGSSEGDLDAD